MVRRFYLMTDFAINVFLLISTVALHTACAKWPAPR